MRWADFAHKHKLVDIQDYADPVHTHVLADITDLEDLVAVKPATLIVNGYSDGGESVLMGSLPQFGKLYLSGALVAGEYLEVLSVVGAGWISHLCVYAVDTTARQIGLKLEVDGVSVFDALSDSISVAATGMIVVGWNTGNVVSGLKHGSGEVPFTTGFKVYLKSTLSETDKVGIRVSYIKT